VTLSRLLSAPSQPGSILNGDGDVLDQLDATRPAAVADLLNRLFPFDDVTEQFATLVYGVLELATGDFRYVTAGHPGPLYLPANGPPVILETPAFPIGLSGERYVERGVRLAAGDRLYLYSDGLPDAMNGRRERFGDARLLRAIDRVRGEPIEGGMAGLLAEVAQWQGDEKAYDDISILAVEVSVVPSPREPGVDCTVSPHASTQP